jgi:hypothetical protein
VKKSLRLKKRVTESAHKNLSALAIAADTVLLPPCWHLKTTIFQPTDDQKRNVPGGI